MKLWVTGLIEKLQAAGSWKEMRASIWRGGRCWRESGNEWIKEWETISESRWGHDLGPHLQRKSRPELQLSAIFWCCAFVWFTIPCLSRSYESHLWTAHLCSFISTAQMGFSQKIAMDQKGNIKPFGRLDHRGGRGDWSQAAGIIQWNKQTKLSMSVSPLPWMGRSRKKELRLMLKKKLCF